MYRLMIVEDEKEAREGLVNWSGWHDLGIQVVAQSDDGETALEMIPSVLPDIILTDVKMPRMDGLTFIKRLRAMGSDVKNVFISAYDDSSYLREALKLSAYDYLLKPLNMEELTACIQRVVRSLEDESERRMNTVKLMENYRRGIGFLKETLIERILRGNVEKDEWIAEAIELTGDLPDKHGCMGVILVANMNGSPYTQPILDRINSSKSVIQSLVLNRENGEFACLLSGAPENMQSEMHALINDLSNAFSSPCAMGISGAISGLSEAPTAIHQARQALMHWFYIGAGSVMLYKQVSSLEQDMQYMPSKAIRQAHFDKLIADENELEKWIIGFSDELKHARIMNPALCTQVFVGLLRELFALLPSGIDSVDDETFSLDRAIYALSNQKCLQDMTEFALKKAAEVKNLMSLRASESTRRSIQITIDYIQKHYAEPLTVSRLCEQAFLSQAYLCALFKEQTGETLIEYLTKVRIEHAKTLLADIRYKLYDVGELVGYPNPSYFARQFKKMTGLTPSEYRDQSL